MTKRISILAVCFCTLLATAQKKEKNGTIYKDHPAIETVNALFKAFLAGDSDLAASYLADDFKSYNGVNGNKDAKGGTKEDFLDNMNWMKENFSYMTITPSNGAYPDALEYKDSGTWVQTWDHIRAVHNKTGVKLDMPMHRLIVLNDENKVKSMINYFDMRIPQEIGRSSADLKNGTLYKNHANINSVRRMMHAMEFSDFDTAYSFFAEDASFDSLELPDGESLTLAQVKERNAEIWDTYEFTSIDEVGYPDYLEYDLGDAKVVQSWWKFRLTRKSDKKTFVIPALYIHDFNDEGKIIRSSAYISTKILDAK
jgi:ketosteroid isomerase-like protein